VFEGTGVKRYVLRYRPNNYSPWQYPLDLQYDTVEEARAALETMPGGYQIVERFPCLRYMPTGSHEITRSKLLNNVLTAFGRKPYRLQWSNGHGWRDCEDLQFDSLKEAQDAVYNCSVGAYQALGATLEFRYEPVEVTGRG